jgi:hypothetical protein
MTAFAGTIDLYTNGRAPRERPRPGKGDHAPMQTQPISRSNRVPVEDRLWSRVEEASNGCWIWTGTKGPGGYGTIGYQGRSYRVHRLAYELVVGKIPDGYQLDHICHSNDLDCPGGKGCLHRACVNPAHLEPVTQRENNLRGRGPTAVHARKTHCVHGHPFSGRNLWVPRPGKRVCRACEAARSRAFQRREREKAKEKKAA